MSVQVDLPRFVEGVVRTVKGYVEKELALRDAKIEALEKALRRDHKALRELSEKVTAVVSNTRRGVVS